MLQEINWTFNNSCLQALALAPRCKDGIDRVSIDELIGYVWMNWLIRYGKDTPQNLKSYFTA